MRKIEGDFEKGQDDGSQAILQVVAKAAKALLLD
jgi:hypothetical protein